MGRSKRERGGIDMGHTLLAEELNRKVEGLDLDILQHMSTDELQRFVQSLIKEGKLEEFELTPIDESEARIQRSMDGKRLPHRRNTRSSHLK